MEKISNYLINYLYHIHKIEDYFVISGGASLHLIHSIGSNKNTKYYCPQHEQAAIMAADGYYRSSKKIACAIATSGPGATNLVTGIASAFFDSIPVLVITGQVASFRDKSNTGSRQVGFQETDIVGICKTITKYSVKITNPKKLFLEIDKALKIAKEGRPGPILIDIPDDFQRMLVDKDYFEKTFKIKKTYKNNVDPKKLKFIYNKLQLAKRPVLILGWGVHLANAELSILKLVQLLKIPVALTWAAKDLVPSNNKYLVGCFGTHGDRLANFCVQNSDLIISIGSRLDTKATGSPVNSFARGAYKIMIDIDKAEIDKFNKFDLKIDYSLITNAFIFIEKYLKLFKDKKHIHYNDWQLQIKKWKILFKRKIKIDNKNINPYLFVNNLSDKIKSNSIIVSDTGCGLAWFMHNFEFKGKQKFIHAFNNTPMGYGLPASIGAFLGSNRKKQTILITGDGSIQMSIQELATVIRNKINIKIILFDNNGHGMVRQTQDMWLNKKYLATSVSGGLPKINFISIFKAYGFDVLNLENPTKIKYNLDQLFKNNKPTLLRVKIKFNEKVTPQVKFGRPNEDAEPLLNRKIFLENMIIEPLDVSKK